MPATHLQGVEEAEEAPAQLCAHLRPAARVQEHLPCTPTPQLCLSPGRANNHDIQSQRIITQSSATRQLVMILSTFTCMHVPMYVAQCHLAGSHQEGGAAGGQAAALNAVLRPGCDGWAAPPAGPPHLRATGALRARHVAAHTRHEAARRVRARRRPAAAGLRVARGAAAPRRCWRRRAAARLLGRQRRQPRQPRGCNVVRLLLQNRASIC